MASTLNTVRRGTGKPLVLVHGLGSSWANWLPVMDRLSAEREVIAFDLPGFGESEPLQGAVTIDTLTDAVEKFLEDENVEGADIVGSSMGGRMVLEMARRGHTGAVVALDPGGFWTPGQRAAFGITIGASISLIRALQPAAPALSNSRIGRSALLFQFSDHPWALDRDVVLTELRSFDRATSLDEAFHALAYGPTQPGTATTQGRVAIGWGRQDRVTLPEPGDYRPATIPNRHIQGVPLLRPLPALGPARPGGGVHSRLNILTRTCSWGGLDTALGGLLDHRCLRRPSTALCPLPSVE